MSVLDKVIEFAYRKMPSSSIELSDYHRGCRVTAQEIIDEIKSWSLDSQAANEGGLMPEPILKGRWHYGNLHLCCGTLRIMRADFDTITDLSEQNKIMQNICDILNTRPTTGWRPMETAPQDETPVLISTASLVGEARYLPDDGNWWWAQTDPCDYASCAILNPTGWQPLPPTQGEKG